jgi:hypothetical protein
MEQHGAHSTLPPRRDVPVLQRPFRVLVAIAAALNLVLAAAFALQQSWALDLWPWEIGRLSYLFLASMLAAVGVAAMWIAVSGDTGSLAAGFLNLAVTLGGISAFLVTTGTRRLGYAIGGLALVNVALLLWSRRLPQPESPRLPALVRGSYVVFTLVLLAVGLALIMRRPGVMPWPLDPDTSVVFGWIFFGDAFYFAYAVWRPRWHSARAQLWSFLGYDAVLIGPLLAHLSRVEPELRLNLIVYLLVLVYSAALGAYYLLLNERTRGWG